MDYINAFWVGGLICVIGQILIDKTKLTPARILTSFVVAGVILGAVGLYEPLADFAGAGAELAHDGCCRNCGRRKVYARSQFQLRVLQHGHGAGVRAAQH